MGASFNSQSALSRTSLHHSRTGIPFYPSVLFVLAAPCASCAQSFVGECAMMNVVGVEVLDWNRWPEKDELRDTEGFIDDKVCRTGSGHKCMLKFEML